MMSSDSATKRPGSSSAAGKLILDRWGASSARPASISSPCPHERISTFSVSPASIRKTRTLKQKGQGASRYKVGRNEGTVMMICLFGKGDKRLKLRRSEERRGGKGCASTCRSGGSSDYKKTT